MKASQTLANHLSVFLTLRTSLLLLVAYRLIKLMENPHLKKGMRNTGKATPLERYCLDQLKVLIPKKLEMPIE